MERARSVLRTPRGSILSSLIAKRYLILEAESVDFGLTKIIPPSSKAGDEACHPPLFQCYFLLWLLQPQLLYGQVAHPPLQEDLIFLLFLTILIMMAATIATSKSVIKIVARFCESHESISYSSLIPVEII
jgi:hypothetical protein